MARTVPHQMAVGLVEKLLGLEVSAQGVKSSVERRAEQVIKLQDEEAQEIKEFEEQWEKSPPSITEQAPDRAIEVAYLEVDGVPVMTRRQTQTTTAANHRAWWAGTQVCRGWTRSEECRVVRSYGLRP
jgi:hypothetical protein